MDRVTRVVGSAFGLGFLPAAPGTWATLGTVAAALLIPAGIPWQIGTSLLFLVACGATIICGTHAEQMLGREDPSFIVTDEVAGTLVALASVTKPELWWFVGAFLLFRVFDILKPWPCRRLEKLSGGFGILMDDLMAGFYAWFVLVVARMLIPTLT